MFAGNLQFDFGAAAIVSIVGFLLALIAWYFTRKRSEPVWLPILRVVEINLKSLPNIRFELPPIILFICFVLGAASIAILSMKPELVSLEKSNKHQPSAHIFIDLSPSMEAAGGIDAIRVVAKELYKNLSGRNRLSLSASNGIKMVSFQDEREFSSWLESLELHRPGSKMGVAFRELGPKLSSVDEIFIISDGERSSWDGFNWKVWANERKLFLANPLLEGRSSQQNYFVDSVKTVLERSGGINISAKIRSALVVPTSKRGTVELSVAGSLLETKNFVISKNEKYVDVRFVISLGRQKELGLSTEQIAQFKLETEQDDIPMDNTLKFSLRGRTGKVMVIAEPSGERSLEDPTYHLGRVLGIKGYQVTMANANVSRIKSIEDTDFIISLGGGTLGEREFCPTKILQSKIKSEDPFNVWLAPIHLGANFKSLCRCVTDLLDVKGNIDTICSESDGSKGWTRLLRSLGGKELGGEIGKSGDELAWGFSPASNIRVTVFTVPLGPEPRAGINHARFPLVVSSFLKLVNKGGTATQEGWPRIDDMSEYWDSSEPETVELLATSNVPAAESLLSKLDAEILPPSVGTSALVGSVSVTSGKEKRESLPILLLLAWAIIAATLFEIAYFIMRQRSRMRAQSSSAILALLVLVAFNSGERAMADTAVVQIGSSSVKLDQLASEVSGRTSIELDGDSVAYPAANSQALEEPWLWVDSLQPVVRGGLFKPEIVMWLRKGGFLILQQKTQLSELKRLTSKSFNLRGVSGAWGVVPPDHELMRSFYLISALPECQNFNWNAFHYDGRLAVLVVPFNLLEALANRGAGASCMGAVDRETAVRIFVNIMMVALATDYKKDQIHLPEILKRLR